MDMILDYAIILAGVVIFGALIAVFGYVVVAILKEVGEDALKGRTDIKKVFNIILGVIVTLGLIMVIPAMVLFAVNEGLNSAIPHMSNTTELIVDNFVSLFEGNGLTYTESDYSVTTGSPLQRDPTPQPTTPIEQGGGIYGQDDNVGGGGYPTASPPLATELPQPLPSPTTHVVTATPSPAWEAPPLP